MRGNEFLEKMGLIAPEYIEEAEEKPKTEPPRFSMAASKLRRVRVLGS